MGGPSVDRSDRLTVYPPGPKRSPLTSIVYFPGRDPLAFFSRLASRYGDLAHLYIGREHLYLVNHPGHVRDILVTHSRSFKNVGVVKSPKDLVSFSRSLMESLSKLDKDNVTAACSKYLSGAEIQNLLKRRDLLLEVYTQHRSEKGEAGIYP